MRLSLALLAVAIASASPAAMGNYLGKLKIPPAPGTTLGGGFYSFNAPALPEITTRLDADAGQRIKLGYKASRYFAVETEYVDFGRNSINPFTNPVVLSSNFRSTGFGVDAIATLPVWNKLSLYGRLGAYRGDVRPGFAPYSTSLVNDATRGTRARYGLGMQYEFNRSLGVRAELERYAPIGHLSPTESDSDTISVGVMWRF